MRSLSYIERHRAKMRLIRKRELDRIERKINTEIINGIARPFIARIAHWCDKEDKCAKEAQSDI